MQKIRLNERQVLMLQQMRKTKVLKINESQYNRLFKEGVKAHEKLSRLLKKGGLTEDSKKVDLLKFAQELIVFIKDMLSRPESAPFSKYWLDFGINKDKLIKLLGKEGLLTANLDETDGTSSYVTEKHGFRERVKNFHKTISEYGDAGYPAGADDHPNNPVNTPDPEPEQEKVGIKAKSEIIKLIYYSEANDGLSVFRGKKGNLFVVSFDDLIGKRGEAVIPYIDGSDELQDANSSTVNNFINDKLNSKEIKAFSQNAPIGELTMVTPDVKENLLKWYGADETLVSIINGIPETTGAASSGAFVGGMTPSNHDRGNSPEKAMQDISEVIDADGVVEFHSDRGGENPFVIDNVQWEYCNVVDGGKVTMGVYRYGQDIAYSYDWFRRNILKIEETTSSGSVGGESGSFAYDAPAGDGSDFWNAGNKMNKGKAEKQNGMPIVRGGSKMHEGFAVGQVYKNMAGRRKISAINKLTGVMKVRQWSGTDGAKDLNIKRKDFGDWELVHENKKLVLKITEAQLKRVLENNQTATAYPDGEMVTFDDCTKLNNNKVAQNGGCSQGDDGVAKYKKTKDSVVAEVARITGKSIKEVSTIIEANESQELIPLIVSAINQVDESLGYEELAKAIGHIINEHYGKHVAERFLNVLSQVIVRE